jgi:phosphatidylglycerophosphate synthase
MRKISAVYENPIDDLLLSLCDYITPICFSLSLTPNHITALSLLIGFASAYYIYQKDFKTGAILFGLSYFLDCLDGHYARAYNMETEFGDWFDHISDAAKSIAIIYALYKVNSDKLKKYYIYLVFFLIIQTMHLGCQEKIAATTKSSSIAFSKILCVAHNGIDMIKYTKYFGCGTMNLILGLFIYNFGTDKFLF